MKLKSYTYLLLFLIIVVLVSCNGKDEETIPDNVGQQNSHIPNENKTGPYPLKVNVSNEDFNDIKSVTLYDVSFIELDENKTKSILLRENKAKEGSSAYGKEYKTENNDIQEILTFFDGGKSLDTVSGINGGLNYVLIKNETLLAGELDSVISAQPDASFQNEQLNEYSKKSDFESYADLHFRPYSELLDELMNLMAELGLPEMELIETYSLDIDTIQEHYEHYLQDGFFEGVDTIFDWKEEHETYLFLLRQIVDGIPVSNITFDNTYSSEMSAYYSKDGLISMDAYNIINILDEESNVDIISASTALEIVEKKFDNQMLQYETAIDSVELNYLIFFNENTNKLVLKPVWSFKVVETSHWIDQLENTEYSIDDYSYFVIDAVTGEQIDKVVRHDE